jgi:ATP-dependent Lon protease
VSIDPTGDGPIIEDVDDVEIPSTLPVIPLRDAVLFPRMIMPLEVTREATISVIDDALASDRLVVVATQRDPDVDAPTGQELYEVGTAGTIIKMVRSMDGAMRVLVQGIRRVKIVGFVKESPAIVARVEPIEDANRDAVEIDGLRRGVIELFGRIVQAVSAVPDEILRAVASIPDASRLTDFIAANINVPPEEKQRALELGDVSERLSVLTEMLTRELGVLEVSSKIQQRVKGEMDRRGREMMLREQLKAIQAELGEGNERALEIDELRQVLVDARLPEEAMRAAELELDRMARMSPAAQEYNVSRTWIDWLAAMPWEDESEDDLDLERARERLDAEHFGLDRVKERILEYLAVLKLKSDLRGPILCFAGPPGVGKTSLGRSIADSMGRKFARISLGGVRDEAEIRGHRRTYVGAMPGRIVQAIRKTGRRNPLVVLDEIDKLGQDFRGDPSSALLEVLDPEQNSTFADHYLEVMFDLSRTMFITTANVLGNIPAPLRDRMEVIEIPGYTDREKKGIARHHLIPRQAENHGVDSNLVTWTDDALDALVRGYTREAGVRNLNRTIASVWRKIARRVAGGNKRKMKVTRAWLHNNLGAERFTDEVAARTSVPGVATGLAWTAAGGDVLFVEATRMPGRGKLTITGSLGDVMKESAQAALSLVRANAAELGLAENFFEDAEIHIHVPAGAIPKDGPSAGVTMVTALASLLTEKPIRSTVAMTGEITLRGKVLPVGGVKEKVLAAHRSGIQTVVLPAQNRRDLNEVPAEVRDAMTFEFAKDFRDVLRCTLDDGTAPRRKPAKKSAKRTTKKPAAKPSKKSTPRKKAAKART